MSAAVSSTRTDTLITALRNAGLLRSAVQGLPEAITGISDDSRSVRSGDLFVAMPGRTSDGHEFVGTAASRGAALALVERDSREGWPLPSIVVTDARRAAALAAGVVHEFPARSLRLAAVTGTNGKSTTVHLARFVLDRSAGSSASIGTLGALLGANGRALPDVSPLTTPSAIELQALLRRCVGAGVRFVAMEVSSHSLAQQRVEGLLFEVAAFTTFTRDHLDYHGTMENYFAAKAGLVERLTPDGTVVLNADDSAWRRLPAARRVLRYGASQPADVRAEEVRPDGAGRGTSWILRTPAGSAPVRLPLIGDFNVGNALAAAAIAHAMGAETAAIAEALSSAPQVPGRLEVLGESPLVLRDYAHTPDALERALAAVRPLAGDQLVVVFGCGGDRDRGKRPTMGEVAARLADRVIVTSDNPRTEDPERIMDDIVSGMPVDSYERVEDRREAIARALALAGPRDVVLIAGKGHETYQIRGTVSHPFDEREIVTELLAVRS